MNRLILFTPLVLLAGACGKPSLDGTLWSCESQDDCPSGLTCSQQIGACVSSNAIIDAGNNNPPDMGIHDAGIEEVDDAGGEPELVSITASPSPISVRATETQALTVTGTFSDGSSLTVTSGLEFESSLPSIASVDASGVVRGVNEGTARITVTVRTVNTLVDVTVRPAPHVLPVYEDGFAAGIAFYGFGGATNDITRDEMVAHSGTASLKINVPVGGYTGGAMRSDSLNDLTTFNAVTFWARASRDRTLDVSGLANNGAVATFQTELRALQLTSEWHRYVIPIPLPAALSAETGMFHFAEGADEGTYTIWLDDIRYEELEPGVLGTPVPRIATQTLERNVGTTFSVEGTGLTVPVNGSNVSVSASPRYFTFMSSNPSVATIDSSGSGSAVGEGSALITAKLAGLMAVGSLTVNVSILVLPDVAAPTPTVPATDVIALYSNAYVAVPVTTWSAAWDMADVTDIVVAGDDVKQYTSMLYAGIEFFPPTIDASTMTHVHVDLWTPDAAQVRIKLVDFGADAAYSGGDDSEHELSYDSTSIPALVTGSWISFDLPLDSFSMLASRQHLAQLVFTADSMSTVYIDNIYFHR